MITWYANHNDKVEVYESADGYRWRVRAANGEIVATGSESYRDLRDARASAERHHPEVKS